MEEKILLRGRYLLSNVIGEGLIGMVYKAKDIVEGKDVAVKMPKKAGESMNVEICATTFINENIRLVKHFG